MPDHSKHLTLQSFNLADKLHTITPGKVTTLDHKVLDNTVECRALVSIALLTGSQNPETVVSITSPSYTHTHLNLIHTGSSQQSMYPAYQSVGHHPRKKPEAAQPTLGTVFPYNPSTTRPIGLLP